MLLLHIFYLFFLRYSYVCKQNIINKLNRYDYLELQNNFSNENDGYDLRNLTDNSSIYDIKVNYFKKNLLNNLEDPNIGINNKLTLIEYYNYIFNGTYIGKITSGGLFDDWN